MLKEMLDKTSKEKDDNFKYFSAEIDKLNKLMVKICNDNYEKQTKISEQNEKQENDLKNSICRISMELADVESKNKILDDQNKIMFQTFKDQMTEKELIISRIKEEKEKIISKSNQDISKLEDNLDKLNCEKVKSEERIEELEVEKYKLEKSESDLSQKLKTTENEISNRKSEFEDKLKGLTNQLNSLEELKTELVKKVENLDNENGNLRKSTHQMDDNLKLKYIYMETLKKQLCEKDETLTEKEKELKRSFMINEELEGKLFQIMQELKQINSLKENIEKNCQKKILEQATLLEEFKSSLIASKEKEIQNQIKEKNEIQLKYSELCRKNTENEIKAQLLKYSNHCNY